MTTLSAVRGVKARRPSPPAGDQQTNNERPSRDGGKGLSVTGYHSRQLIHNHLTGQRLTPSHSAASRRLRAMCRASAAHRRRRCGSWRLRRNCGRWSTRKTAHHWLQRIGGRRADFERSGKGRGPPGCYCETRVRRLLSDRVPSCGRVPSCRPSFPASSRASRPERSR